MDTLKDNEMIRDELLAITLGVWDHVKNRSAVDASHWALEWVGFLPGKRESRRFVGRQVLTETDVFESRPWGDAIAFGGWPIDTHPPEGVDAPDLPPCHQHHLPYLYGIPLRSCVARSPENLMFAGRNISATHIAFATTRVMATCAAIGQGVATAAAVALRAGITPGQLTERPELWPQVQQQLLRDDCYLVGVRNADKTDLVRQAAAIVASSEQSGGEAENVRSGQTRSVHGPAVAMVTELKANLWDDEVRDPVSRGANTFPVTCAPPDRAFPGTHRWMSDPGAGLPAWLEVRWNEAVAVREVVIVFDTGLHRLLTLSPADGYTAKMQWGRPQEETVRDYTIEMHTERGWELVVQETGNYQRLRRHKWGDLGAARALRISVSATQGLDHARIMEIRAYG